MSTLAERLKLAMSTARIKQVDLARACEIRPPSVADWLTGRTKNIRGANLVAAAKLLKVNEAWLADGKGPMERSQEPDGWPFPGISPAAYYKLSAADREEILTLVKMKVDRLSKSESAAA
ncbi:helix-turn-helix domain-containing protein [Bordetella hinzii]|uniref:helix-turn-helix domain-containing protein n=1 Tax=Bordetella hinzii TaxID=103855 RepID=UPI0039FCC982